ncbi:hypothetical protein [Peptostreptococcus canis]|uniref:Uncharacterized protein n=1 Tax=Peptostreptococcus canis TaxID=1159213 RepID=A0ABR6TMF7_9FIRM|nr:hypothetical protein [Peptostreptococcus canis]MBC2576589.1 hypothetical protein [Peptostreptococcus canis]MBP1998776.1 hypothetical protein [Peptostreptococcus canis]
MEGYKKTQENRLNIITGENVADIDVINENFIMHEENLGSIDSIELDGFKEDNEFNSKKSITNLIKFIWKKIGMLSNLKTLSKTNLVDSINELFIKIKDNKEDIKKLDEITKPNLVDNSSAEWKSLNIYAGVTSESGIKKNIGDFLIKQDYSTDDTFTLSAKIEYQIQEPVYGKKAKISIQAKGDVTNNEHMISSSVEKTGTGEFIHTNKFKLNSKQLTNNVFNFSMRIDNVLIGTFKVKELKIEKGETATAWCYSANDIVTLDQKLNKYTGNWKVHDDPVMTSMIIDMLSTVPKKNTGQINDLSWIDIYKLIDEYREFIPKFDKRFLSALMRNNDLKFYLTGFLPKVVKQPWSLYALTSFSAGIHHMVKNDSRFKLIHQKYSTVESELNNCCKDKDIVVFACLGKKNGTSGSSSMYATWNNGNKRTLLSSYDLSNPQKVESGTIYQVGFTNSVFSLTNGQVAIEVYKFTDDNIDYRDCFDNLS